MNSNKSSEKFPISLTVSPIIFNKFYNCFQLLANLNTLNSLKALSAWKARPPFLSSDEKDRPTSIVLIKTIIRSNALNLSEK